MLTQRLISTIIIVPVAIFLAWASNWTLAVFIAAALGFAAWEYYQLFTHGGYSPSAPLLILGTVLLVIGRRVFSFTGSDLFLAFFVLITLFIQVIAYERGKNSAALDFNITIAGIVYLGFLGGYIISLRDMADGFWWLMLVIPGTAIGDGMAYIFGRKWGRHKISQRVSPKKSWEGYIAGAIGTALGAMGLAALWHLRAPAITWDKGLILGLVLGITSIIGDLGESMLKRGFGVKDTSVVIPGHGGVMDRMDSWIWSAPIGYYLILLLWR
jgi:phosphatidate cytidylyltransferase